MNKRLVTGEKRETANWITASVNWTIPGQNDLLTLLKTLSSTQRCSQVLSYPSLSPLLRDGYRRELWDRGSEFTVKMKKRYCARYFVSYETFETVCRWRKLRRQTRKQKSWPGEPRELVAVRRNCWSEETLRKLNLECNERIFEVIYQAWDAVFHHQMKHREKSWKYNAQRSIIDELRGVASGDETLCQMLDITSQTK